jgi:lambda family phage portal protein
MTGSVRFRIKGSQVYVEPGRFRADAGTSAPYLTAGRSGRSLKWRPSNIGPNAALDYAAGQLRNQSRDLIRKNALAASAISTITSNVIGTGIKPQVPSPDAGALWLKWTDESAADGMLDFYGQQSQVCDAWAAVGECFVRMRTRLPQDGLSVPLQLEILESEFVPMELNRVEQSGNIIRQGIEFDKNVRSKRVAYWMYSQHPGESNVNGTVDVTPHRVPAEEVCHVFCPSRPGQIRGEPILTRALDRLLDVEAYDKAELVRKKISAMYVGFLRRNLPADLGLEELKEIWGEDAAVSGGIGDVTMEPGTMQVLAPGEDVEFSDPKDVGGQYDIFMRAQHRAIAASVGILYEQLTGDYSQVNDRTWRAAMNEFKRGIQRIQHQIVVHQFCRPVWQRWAQLAVLSGAIKGLDPAVPVKWTPQAWAYINPVQDVQAAREEIRSGLNSREAIVSERGEDSAQIDRENAAGNKRADELGLVYDSDGRVAVSKGAGQPTTMGTEDPSVEPAKSPSRKTAQ